jgi:7-keto-8-aminopelargonate synthetase-like enzyme
MKANPDIAMQLQARSKFFLEACIERGLDTGPSKDSAVVPVIVGNSLECLQLSQRLSDQGINVQPIVYPAVEDESSRLRFFLSATHTEEQLQRTADVCAEELAAIQRGAAAE